MSYANQSTYPNHCVCKFRLFNHSCHKVPQQQSKTLMVPNGMVAKPACILLISRGVRGEELHCSDSNLKALYLRNQKITYPNLPNPNPKIGFIGSQCFIFSYIVVKYG